MINIEGKEYRHIFSFLSKTYDDITGRDNAYNAFIYIYIYNKVLVSRSVTDAGNDNVIDEFGRIGKELRKIQRDNLNRRIQKGNNPVSIGTYKIFDDYKIEMKWHFHETTEIVFKGEILLDGDAIKGTFYKNGEVNVSDMVYYNIDKPLPDKLIE